MAKLTPTEFYPKDWKRDAGAGSFFQSISKIETYASNFCTDF
ncbi:hypothetical protein [uncultured Chryseobacterium sp.]|nr:hypothetical protein [uncultured Chryseobacterium sp.]